MSPKLRHRGQIAVIAKKTSAQSMYNRRVKGEGRGYNGLLYRVSIADRFSFRNTALELFTTSFLCSVGVFISEEGIDVYTTT